tara:strand:+ start:27188 stop:28291 length:1104 start_codon:yes stop_codon:yes gene_type:complete
MVVLIAIGALSYFLDFSKQCPPNFKFYTHGFYLVDQKFIGSDASFDPAKNLFYLILKNTFIEKIVISEIVIKENNIICGSLLLPDIELNKGAMTNQLIGKITNPICQGLSRACYNFDVEIKYRNIDSGLTHAVKGRIGGTFEANPSQLWALGGPWDAQAITGNTLEVDDRTGEKINYCIPETPPTSSTFTEEVPTGIIFWDLPSGCSTSGIAQVGFESATCDDRSQLAKGWLHNTLYLDNIFSVYDIFIGGNAGYLDTTTGDYKTNGICLNDNLYFYVNGALRYWGGTTGIMLGDDNTYQAGDEVLRHCDGCSDVDSSAWCIPAFELTASGFNYGQSNDIEILVEDFCKGGGQPHAGGMSELRLILI